MDNSEKNMNNYIEGVIKDLESYKINENLNVDPNIAYNDIDNILKNCHEKYFPLKTVRFNKYRHKINPWINKETINIIKN